MGASGRGTAGGSDISMASAPTANSATSALQGAAGEGWVFPGTAQVFQGHPGHTQGKGAGLQGRRQGGGQDARSGSDLFRHRSKS